MQSLPPLNLLRAFEATARLQSFTKAAEELNVTRAAVSQQVKSLESQLNATLFERKGTHLTLTCSAQEYWPVVNHVLQTLSTTTQHLFTRPKNTQVNLHVAHSFCSQWLMPRLADFQRQFPDISFKISTTANTVPSASAIADIEIINGDGDWQEQEAIRLTQENWIVVASPGFMHLNPINDLLQLAKAPKICTSGYHESWQEWLTHQGYQGKVSKVVAEFEHSLLAIHAAINQLGVLLVRDFLVEDELQQGVLVQAGNWHMPSSGAHYMMVRASEKSHVNTFAQWLIQSL
ncbi:LysR substrate-binding domain-containing protein [Vibrio alginolyticus]|uniref:LysR substrate-binding domain-containing protein n=1 Tax=Vibrio alginolyticus TaxID=663 RepID=UPI001B832AAD|nr:LysR family transcriptional regulator [Vibrio alginolyticus]